MLQVTPFRVRRILGLGGRVIAGTFLVGMCMASSCWPTGTDAGTTTDGGSVSGPSLEITVDGTHVGPYTLSGNNASLVDTKDSFGQLAQSVITLQLSATGGGITEGWVIQVERFGSNLVPFGANPYTIEEDTGATPDRTATLPGLTTITAGNLTLQCGSADCQGLFVIDVIDAAHIEGYFTATMTNPQDGQQSSVVVTFYAPWTTYSP